MGIKVCFRELRTAVYPPSLSAFVPLKRTLITTSFVLKQHNLFIIIWDDWIHFKLQHYVPLYGWLVFPKLEVCPFFPATQQPNSALRSLTVAVYRSHKMKHTYKMGLPRTSDQLIPQADPYNAKNNAGEEPPFNHWDSNPRSQQRSHCRHWPSNTATLGLAVCIVIRFKISLLLGLRSMLWVTDYIHCLFFISDFSKGS